MKRIFIIVFGLIGLVFYQASAQADKPPYVSPVPKFKFAQTLKEQQEQLKTNPLMLRFAESRKKQASDRYRPIYHFVSPESNLNDPNGLCFWQGNWHMFYQAYPPEDQRQHWGHAVSPDLIHWKDLPYAIYPSPEKAVFSGSTLVEDNRVIAMYHGTTQGNFVALSDDPLLLNWEKINNGQPVVPMVSPTGFPLPYRVFDPCIWKKDGIYYSLSGGRNNKGPAGKPLPTVYLFRSKDLVNWEYLHEFVEDDRFTFVSDDYAVPYFWPIGNRYLFTFASHLSGGQYLLGDYDTEKNKFRVSNHGRFNFGTYSFPPNASGLNAPSATPDGKGGLIVIFNLMNNKPVGEWGQIMTLPRRLFLIGKDDIGQEPAGDIESLRYDRKVVKSMPLPANKEVVLKEVRGNAMELSIEIDPKKSSLVELNLLRSSNKEEFTRIALYKEGGFSVGRQGLNLPSTDAPPATGTTVLGSLITIETQYSSLAGDIKSRAPSSAPVIIEPNETIKLRVFIDKSVVEVFVNGRQALSARVFPSRDDSIGVSLRSQGNDCELKSLEAWQMKSIY
ncbi:MAG TPA: glycoside hydrolase family 32 protein [Cyclobacteriaceae bacterium]|nr:glycoside hydrolase family 32 protein [Cyclobacteriaceae bacterium]